MKKKFRCEIDCANCAAKVEDAIRKIDGVEEVQINFLTQKLSLTAEEARFDAILAEAIKVGRRVESDFDIEVR